MDRRPSWFCTQPVTYANATRFEIPAPRKSQSAMCAARAREIYEREAKERQQVRKGDQAGASPANLPDLNKGDARDKAGEAFGVSGRSVDFATKVINEHFSNLSKLLVAERQLHDTILVVVNRHLAPESL